MHRCNTCNIEKEVKEFHKRKDTPTGYSYKCKLCTKSYDKKYSKDNKEKRSIQNKTWRENNKEYLAEYFLNWARNNKDKVKIKTNKRRSKKLQATPKWLTGEMVSDMENWYILSEELRWLSEEDFHVDHIVPLQGKNVCGLNVPWNLQLLSKGENLRKSNRMED